MEGDGVLVDFGHRAFLGANATGEVTEMIGGEWYVGVHRLSDWLTVVAGLDPRQQCEVFLNPISDLVEQPGALH